MKTIILDDDPTGTQSAAGVDVLLHIDEVALEEVLTDADSVYVQTNSRALAELEAVALCQQIKSQARAVATRLGEDVRFVLRGDSTLRGHVFAETAVFMEDDAVMLFVPAFPDGGRVTIGGVHYLLVGGRHVPMHETEYAADPVFGFSTAVLVDYVQAMCDRPSRSVALEDVRSGALALSLVEATAGSVVLPDAETNRDIRLIADAVDLATAAGRSVVVRSAAPLAAELAGVTSSGLLEQIPAPDHPSVLLVCGSHTRGASAQPDRVAERWGDPRYIDTEGALAAPVVEGERVADGLATDLRAHGFAMIASRRERLTAHDTLDHGQRIMTALTTAVSLSESLADVVVAKGGITSADTARIGLGATRARVLGQILPGVSVWSLRTSAEREISYVVVPGNVGGPSTLVDVLAALPSPAKEVAR